jgi:hypothetical protein
MLPAEDLVLGYRTADNREVVDRVLPVEGKVLDGQREGESLADYWKRTDPNFPGYVGDETLRGDL